MIALLVYLIIGCLLIYCVRMLLPMTGLPGNVINVICIIIAVIFLLWLVSGIMGTAVPKIR